MLCQKHSGKGALAQFIENAKVIDLIADLQRVAIRGNEALVFRFVRTFGRLFVHETLTQYKFAIDVLQSFVHTTCLLRKSFGVANRRRIISPTTSNSILLCNQIDRKSFVALVPVEQIHVVFDQAFVMGASVCRTLAPSIFHVDLDKLVKQSLKIFVFRLKQVASNVRGFTAIPRLLEAINLLIEIK